MSIQDPNDPRDWLPNEFTQPSATLGERPAATHGELYEVEPADGRTDNSKPAAWWWRAVGTEYENTFPTYDEARAAAERHRALVLAAAAPARLGERPRIPEPWSWEDESSHLIDNDDHALSLLDAETLALDDGNGRVFAIPLACIEALVGRLAAAVSAPGERPVEPKDSGESRGNENDSEHRTSSGSATQRQAHRENGMERQGDVARASGTRSAQQDDGAVCLHEDGAGRSDSVAVLAGGLAGDGLGNRDVAPLVDPAPGERVPGGGPLPGVQAALDELLAIRPDKAGLVDAHVAIAIGCLRDALRAAAPAVSPPLRDEPAGEDAVTTEQAMQRARIALEDAEIIAEEAGRFYHARKMRRALKGLEDAIDAESFRAAAPSTREGPGEVERLRAALVELRDAFPGSMYLQDKVRAALGSTGGADPRGHFLRELASEFFHGTTFDDLIAASPNKPASVVIADELYRRAAAFGGVAGR